MPKEERTLILVFSIVVVVALVGIVLLPALDLAKKDTIGFEIVKVLTQFLFVVVIGVLISLFVQNYNRQRDQEVKENDRQREKEILINDLRKTVLIDLITAYSDTKKARRILMGNRLSDQRIPYKIYDEQMRNIIETQLALELLTHQIKTFKAYFGENVDKLIIDKVTMMEKFLGDIIDDYKDALKGQSQIPETIVLNSLQKLNSSMGKEKLDFGNQFVEPYRVAVKEIRQQVLT
jgi:hypothetical protein